ncbi:MAG TPA: hypothetical protein ACFYEA_11530 [Candidatus Tripitaka californicus]|uniref:hypothetical protein n=1 Tax=Candidatus Tripitaka californicus TaxID=3367616 RepID=UPI00402A222B
MPCTLRGAWLPTVYCLLLLLADPAFSETMGWAATYGGEDWDVAESVQQTREGGYIVAGSTKSFGAGKDDVWVLKLRPDGTIDWQKAYGGEKDEVIYSIQQTVDGGYVLAGWTESFGAGDSNVWVLKLRADGTVEWQKTYGEAKEEGASCIQQTSDGGYIVVGGTRSFGDNGRGQAWVLKLRVDGSVEWQKTYGGASSDWARSIQQTNDGGYVVAGTTASFGVFLGLSKFWVLKLRADGTVEGQRAYGGESGESARSIQQTSDGGYIVTGGTNSFGVGGSNIWVLKLSPDGMVEWQESYGTGNSSEAYSIQQTSDGGYIVGGWMEEESTLVDLRFWVLKLGVDGIVEWQKTYKKGSNWLNQLYSIQQTRDGGYIVAGETKSSGGASDFWVLKLRPDGSFGHAQDKSTDPTCEFVKETDISGMFSNAMLKNTTASPVDSNAIPQDTLASVQDTNASVDILCPLTTIEP